MNYNFRKATLNEVKHIFELIQRRMNWMDRVGIKQWNVTDVLLIFSNQMLCNNLEQLNPRIRDHYLLE